jgi:hypothetical protein
MGCCIFSIWPVISFNNGATFNPSTRMKLDSRTRANIRWLLVILWVVLSTRPVTAQCPAGSISNAAGSYTNGQTVCISTAFSGAITLTNGATMVIVSGGNYTGNITTNQGSVIQIQTGGKFAPSQANTFSADLTNNGTVVMNNVSLSSGAAITNTGSFTWASSWNQNAALTVSNTACGTMTFSTSANVGSGAIINNNGVLNFTQDLNTNSGTTINNRGTVTVNGTFTSTGLFYNQNKAVFTNGIFNTGNTSDSIVNLGSMTFSGSVTGSTGIRNEGLFYVGGSYSINGNDFRINNSNAQLRVNGGLSNNGNIQGNGSLYVAGSVSNNQQIKGNNASAGQKLTVNQSMPGSTSNLIVNGALVAADPNSYTPTMSNPASCSVLAEKLSGLQAVYNNGRVQLNWLAYAQANARAFIIEYSLDGRSFAEAGELAAAIPDDVTTAYSFVHSPGVTGTVYYRVRETDLDGNNFYTNMVVVKTGNTLTASTAVFPNPFKDILQISMQLEKAGVIQVALFDASGRLVKKVQQAGLLGRNTIVMSNLTALLPGVYLVQIKADKNSSFQKLIK